MFYFVLDGELEPDVTNYAARRCRPGDYVVYREQAGKVVAGFCDEDRATLFLNLFDDEIECAYEGRQRQSAA
jgi:hypothetical protein